MSTETDEVTEKQEISAALKDARKTASRHAGFLTLSIIAVLALLVGMNSGSGSIGAGYLWLVGALAVNAAFVAFNAVIALNSFLLHRELLAQRD